MKKILTTIVILATIASSAHAQSKEDIIEEEGRTFCAKAASNMRDMLEIMKESDGKATVFASLVMAYAEENNREIEYSDIANIFVAVQLEEEVKDFDDSAFSMAWVLYFDGCYEEYVKEAAKIRS